MNRVRIARNWALPPGAGDEVLAWLGAVGVGSSSVPAWGGLQGERRASHPVCPGGPTRPCPAVTHGPTAGAAPVPPHLPPLCFPVPAATATDLSCGYGAVSSTPSAER